MRVVILSCCRSYFLNRQQTVFINEAFSDFKVINSAVPRRSILGRLLFIIYTNDFFIVENFLINMFAVDTTLCTLLKLWMTDALVLTSFACKSGSLVVIYN